MRPERTRELMAAMEDGGIYTVGDMIKLFPRIDKSDMYHYMYRLVAEGLAEKIDVPLVRGKIGRPATAGYRLLWRRR